MERRERKHHSHEKHISHSQSRSIIASLQYAQRVEDCLAKLRVEGRVECPKLLNEFIHFSLP